MISEEQAKFLSVFKERPSLSMDELKEKSKLDEDALMRMLDSLMFGGIVIGSTSSKGIKIYRLMSFYPGLFEYSLMKGEKGEKEQKLVKLYEKYFDELKSITQSNYDNLLPLFKKIPPITRISPSGIEGEKKTLSLNIKLENKKEIVLSSMKALELVDLHDDISVSNCYCRHEKELLNEPCLKKAPKENCLLFGKSARFAVAHNFAKAISSDEAKRLIREAEDYGLVHKIFHIHQDISKDVEAICNCCSCCCGVFQFYKKGIMPYHTHTTYLARVMNEECTGCGECVNVCPMETISIQNDISVIGEDKCIGCGVCVKNCPAEAISLEDTGLRNVFIPPIKALGSGHTNEIRT